MLTFAGVSHLTTARDEFQAQVPDWFPVDPDVVVVVSGVAEVGLGLGLLALEKPRVAVGLATATFFVVIFPGNIAQYAEGTDAFGLDTDRKRFVRLFFQPLLVAWAAWSTGAWRALRAARRTATDRASRHPLRAQPQKTRSTTAWACRVARR